MSAAYLAEQFLSEVEAVEDSTSDPRVQQLVEAMARVGASDVGEILGSGSFGVAAALGEGRVIKLTSDPAEVQVGALLVGKSLPHVVRFDGAWFVRGVTVKPVDEDGRAKVGLLIEERVTPLAPAHRDRESLEIARVVASVKERHDWGQLLTLRGAAKRRKWLCDMESDMEASLERAGFDEISSGLAEMREHGICAVDVHPGNLGRDDDYVLKIFDVGVGSPPPGAVRPKAVAGKRRAAALAAAEVVVGEPKKRTAAAREAERPEDIAFALRMEVGRTLTKEQIAPLEARLAAMLDRGWGKPWSGAAEVQERRPDVGKMFDAAGDYGLDGRNLTHLGRTVGVFDLGANAEDGVVVEVNKLEILPALRGRGYARGAMAQLVAIADANGWTLALSPTSAWGSSKSRLAAFYKSLGFVPNRGKGRDFRFRDAMYRAPSAAEEPRSVAEPNHSCFPPGLQDAREPGKMSAMDDLAERIRAAIDADPNFRATMRRDPGWTTITVDERQTGAMAAIVVVEPRGKPRLVGPKASAVKKVVEAAMRSGAREYEAVDTRGKVLGGPYAHHDEAKKVADKSGGYVRWAGEKLTTSARSALPASSFALPARRELPLNDAAHVRAAASRLSEMRRLGHVTPAEHRSALAKVKAAGRRLGVDVQEGPDCRHAHPPEVPVTPCAAEGTEDFAVMERDQAAVAAGQELPPLDSPKAFYDFAAASLLKQTSECFVVVPLDVHGRPLNPKPYLVAMGQRDRVAIEVEQVHAPVVATNAAAFAVLHQHPGNSKGPSEADTALHKMIEKATSTSYPSVAYLDSLIVTRGAIYSSRDRKSYACR